MKHASPRLRRIFDHEGGGTKQRSKLGIRGSRQLCISGQLAGGSDITLMQGGKSLGIGTIRLSNCDDGGGASREEETGQQCDYAAHQSSSASMIAYVFSDKSVFVLPTDGRSKFRDDITEAGPRVLTLGLRWFNRSQFT
jgi:hypothetical protein